MARMVSSYLISNYELKMYRRWGEADVSSSHWPVEINKDQTQDWKRAVHTNLKENALLSLWSNPTSNFHKINCCWTNSPFIEGVLFSLYKSWRRDVYYIHIYSRNGVYIYLNFLRFSKSNKINLSLIKIIKINLVGITEQEEGLCIFLKMKSYYSFLQSFVLEPWDYCI